MRTLFLLSLTAAGCFSGPDLRQLELGLASGASIGLSASMAMRAIADPSASLSACAAVQTACAAYPCSGAVRITLGDGCPLPLGGAATGAVTVTGNWSSASQATLHSTFESVAVGGHGTVVTDVTALDASSSSGVVTVSYVGQNVHVAGGTALVAQATWNVRVDDAGTPADASDDSYTVDSTSQNVGGTTVTQITSSGVALTPACRQNPTSGSATLQVVSLTHITQTQVQFHGACDGNATVNNSNVALHFLQ